MNDYHIVRWEWNLLPIVGVELGGDESDGPVMRGFISESRAGIDWVEWTQAECVA